MKVTIVPSSQPGQLSQLFTSYVVDGRVAIDAGCLDGVGSIDDMCRITQEQQPLRPMRWDE